MKIMKSKTSILILLIILTLISSQASDSMNFTANLKNTFEVIEINTNRNFFNSQNENIINETIFVDVGNTTIFENTTFYCNISSVFNVYGELIIRNCAFYFMQNETYLFFVDDGKITLENVTIDGRTSPYNHNYGRFISAYDSSLNFRDTRIYNFDGAFIMRATNISMIDVFVNTTSKIEMRESNDIFIKNTHIEMIGSKQISLVDFVYCDNITLEECKISLPLTTVQEYGPWVESLKFGGSNDILVRNCELRNGGKILTSSSSTNLWILNNTIYNDILVEGTELQIAGMSVNVTIENNTFFNLWDSVEIYSYSNITVKGNTIYSQITGFYVYPFDKTTYTDVKISNNTQIGGGAVMREVNGVIMENNTLIEAWCSVENSTDFYFFNNTLLESAIGISNSNNISIISNTVYLDYIGQDWLFIDNSSYTESNNIIITVPVISEFQNGFSILLIPLVTFIVRYAVHKKRKIERLSD